MDCSDDENVYVMSETLGNEKRYLKKAEKKAVNLLIHQTSQVTCWEKHL